MEDRRVNYLLLASGEVRQVRLLAGSTVFVACGHLAWRDPPAWYAETLVADCRRLGPEETCVIERSGWVEMSARGRTQVVIVAPQRRRLWRRLVTCLWRLFRQGSGVRKLALPD